MVCSVFFLAVILAHPKSAIPDASGDLDLSLHYPLDFGL